MRSGSRTLARRNPNSRFAYLAVTPFEDNSRLPANLKNSLRGCSAQFDRCSEASIQIAFPESLLKRSKSGLACAMARRDMFYLISVA